jgi:hypothetical protein
MTMGYHPGWRRVAPAASRALAFLVLLAAAAVPAHATVITASPVDFSVNEQSLFNGAVATFVDDNPGASPADFTATINWGDGSPTTAGSIGSNSAAFVVIGQHTYADEGSFTVTVTIADASPGTGTATATDTASVLDADRLAGTPVTFSAPAGVSFTTTVGNFTDTLTGTAAADFTATIDWGDATTSAGTVSGGSGAFQVSGTHTYAGAGTFSVTVTLSDDPPGTATAQVTSTAHVAAGAGVAVAAQSFTVAEGSTFNGTVATFSDSDTSKTAASFTSTISWGDGTAATAGTVTGSSGSFTLTGTHVYADEGSFTTSIVVTEVSPGTASGTAMGTATVTDADVLTGTPVTFAAHTGIAFTGTVATFTDAFTGAVPSDFTATIDWGDATTSAGTVAGGGGTFTVTGTHTYLSVGTFTVKVTLADDPPGTATATASSTANVVAAPPLASIPTLDLRGLLALVLLLSAAGWRRLRKEARAP